MMIDNKLKKSAGNKNRLIPADYDSRISSVLASLPDEVPVSESTDAEVIRRKVTVSWRPIVSVAAVFAVAAAGLFSLRSGVQNAFDSGKHGREKSYAVTTAAGTTAEPEVTTTVTTSVTTVTEITEPEITMKDDISSENGAKPSPAAPVHSSAPGKTPADSDKPAVIVPDAPHEPVVSPEPPVPPEEPLNTKPVPDVPHGPGEVPTPPAHPEVPGHPDAPEKPGHDDRTEGKNDDKEKDKDKIKEKEDEPLPAEHEHDDLLMFSPENSFKPHPDAVRP